MRGAERLNGISALCGAVLAAAGVSLLLGLAIHKGDPWRIASFAFYGAGLLAVYSSSTLYHSLQGRAKRIFQKLDHLSIYLLIAGTYAPFMLITLRGSFGWTIFGVVSALAVAGIIIDLLPQDEARLVPLFLYLAMGWLGVFTLGRLFRALPPRGLACIVAGGLFYTSGLIFYQLEHRLPHGHAIWHAFALAGSAAHFIAVLLYVA